MFDLSLALYTMEFFAVAGGATAGVVALHRYVASRVVHKIQSEYASQINEFKKANTATHPLQLEFCEAAQELLTAIQKAQDMRDFARTKMSSLKISEDNSFELLPNLEKKLAETEENFGIILAQVYGYKVGSLLKGEIKRTAAHGVDAAKHATAHLSKVEHLVVDALHKFKVVDAVGHVTHDVKKILAKTVFKHKGDAAYESASQFFDHASDIIAFPGVASGAKAALTEIKLLLNDKTTMSEAFEHGIMPALMRSGLIAIGVALDSATGWMSMGLFTIAASYFSKKATDQIIIDKINELVSSLNVHINNIRDRQRKALNAINQVTAKLLNTFKKKIDACPDIGQEEALSGFTKDLGSAYRKGLLDAQKALTENTKKAIEKLPQKTWVDRVLFINRPHEVAKLFKQVERELSATALGVVHGFSKGAEKHPLDAMKFVVNGQVFSNPETIAVLKTMQEVTEASTESYAKSLTGWEKECIQIWQTGTQEVATVTEREHTATRALVKREERAMAPLQRRIEAMQARLG